MYPQSPKAVSEISVKRTKPSASWRKYGFKPVGRSGLGSRTGSDCRRSVVFLWRGLPRMF